MTTVDIKMIPVGDIEANDYNPNVMEQELFDLLIAQIKEEGMIQPILVRPSVVVGGVQKYIAVDGEHRFRASVMAELPEVACVVMTYSDDDAKLKTVAMNRLRGNFVPLKMAKLMVDLQERFDPETIQRMTGIGKDELKSFSQLLDMPELDFGDAPTITVDNISRPISVTLMLMPDEHGSWKEAMLKAMELAGPMVTPLLWAEVGQYDKAMTTAMGLTGVKLRNVALATILRVFNSLDEVTKAKMVEQVAQSIE